MVSPSTPVEPFTLHGGCNCRAIRYTLNFPALDERPTFVTAPGFNEEEQPSYPSVCFDHCNDCRRATGSLLVMWIIVPRVFMTLSFLKKSAAKAPGSRDGISDEERIEIAGREIRVSDAEDTFLGYFNSSPERFRSFCSRCGTNLFYLCEPMPEGLLPTIDFLFGTLDREDIERYQIRPDRHLWWDYGMDWMKALVADGDRSISLNGQRLKRHPQSARSYPDM